MNDSVLRGRWSLSADETYLVLFVAFAHDEARKFVRPLSRPVLLTPKPAQIASAVVLT